MQGWCQGSQGFRLWTSLKLSVRSCSWEFGFQACLSKLLASALGQRLRALGSNAASLALLQRGACWSPSASLKPPIVATVRASIVIEIMVHVPNIYLKYASKRFW